MTEAYIYALCDPESGDVRYVGMTLRPALRLKQHTADNNPSLKVKWIKELRTSGKQPTMMILETCPVNERYTAEQRWIGSMQRQGIKLLNGLPDLERHQRPQTPIAWVRPLSAAEHEEARMQGEAAAMRRLLVRWQAQHERDEGEKATLRIKLAAAESVLDKLESGKRAYGVAS